MYPNRICILTVLQSASSGTLWCQKLLFLFGMSTLGESVLYCVCWIFQKRHPHLQTISLTQFSWTMPVDSFLLSFGVTFSIDLGPISTFWQLTMNMWWLFLFSLCWPSFLSIVLNLRKGLSTRRRHERLRHKVTLTLPTIPIGVSQAKTFFFSHQWHK